ncbi:MAG TPA: ATP-binding protein [Gaiellaceae bacterium]|jgi:signal transduction histidine kinase
MSRWPIRIRLTAAFVAAMAVVLVAVGAFVYLRLADSLDDAIDSGLGSRSDELAALVQQPGFDLEGGSTVGDEAESFAQVMRADRTVVAASAVVGGRPVLTAGELERASREPVFLERARLGGFDDGVRLLAVPVTGRDLVVVVGSSLEVRNEALAGLLFQLGVGGPIALALAALLAYALAAAALRPVEAMRREAEAIGASEPGRRLPVPEARDEIARLGKTLNEMLTRLESALAHERTFVANASHELRTPLALLQAELDVALRQPRSPQELEAALRSAAQEADRLSRLAEDLLVLARADEGRLPMRPEVLDGGELLRDVGARFEPRAAEVGRPLTVDGGRVELYGDRLRLEQALGNLVDNALRHGDGEIRLELAERDGRVELHVLDEGPGFEPGFVDGAFDRFTRRDESRSEGGSGLGLAIAAVIGRAHGGGAGACDRPGGGADVWIEVPRSRGGAFYRPGS